MISTSDLSYQQANRFVEFQQELQNHTPSAEGLNHIREIRAAAEVLGHAIIKGSAPSRNQALALTALEESVMRAVRAVALQGTPTDSQVSELVQKVKEDRNGKS